MQGLVKIAAGILLVSCGAVFLSAQEVYPSRPITLVQGFGAGGNADTIARIIAEPLGSRLGKPVIVEARPGAGGNIASAQVAKAAPDGYTLILLTGGHAVSAALYKTLAFEPVDDFQMLSTTGFLPFVVAVKADSPIRSMSELIARAKAEPGKLTYSSVGVGSTQHLAGELLSAMAGINMIHVPYRGGGAPMNDLLGGQIDVLIDTITVAGPQIASGKVRGIGVTSPAPWWSHPDIPPIASAVPGYDVRTWLGLATAKGVPAEVVKRLNSEIVAALQLEPTRAGLQRIGMDVHSSSPEEMRELVVKEISKWKNVVSGAGIPQQ
jgi:tripartite-type tricarboxylate transporter receptor subunit TctC